MYTIPEIKHTLLVLVLYTVKPLRTASFKKTKNLVYKTNYRLMQVKRIAECSKWGILQYFRLSFGYQATNYCYQIFVLSIFEWPFYTGFTVVLSSSSWFAMIFRLVPLAALSIPGRSRRQVYTLFIHIVRKTKIPFLSPKLVMNAKRYISQHTNRIDLIVLELISLSVPFIIIITLTEYGCILPNVLSHKLLCFLFLETKNPKTLKFFYERHGREKLIL